MKWLSDFSRGQSWNILSQFFEINFSKNVNFQFVWACDKLILKCLEFPDKYFTNFFHCTFLISSLSTSTFNVLFFSFRFRWWSWGSIVDWKCYCGFDINQSSVGSVLKLKIELKLSWNWLQSIWDRFKIGTNFESYWDQFLICSMFTLKLNLTVYPIPFIASRRYYRRYWCIVKWNKVSIWMETKTSGPSSRVWTFQVSD